MSTVDRLAARYSSACHALNRDEWAPGMRRLRWAPGAPDHLAALTRVPDGPDLHDYDREPVVPDFTDPATVGCLLAAVREAWQDGGIHAKSAYRPAEGARWLALPPGGYAHGYGETEAEALIAALEAAAARRPVPRG
jgi:hypothetical protein